MNARCPQIGNCCVFISALASSIMLTPELTPQTKLIKTPQVLESETAIRCRSIGVYHTILEDYKRDTCAKCYCYLSDDLFINKSHRFLIDPVNFTLVSPDRTYSIYADPFDADHEMKSNFVSHVAIDKWRECCDAAVKCCKKMSSTPEPSHKSSESSPMCPRTWDGWSCFDDAVAGTTVEVPCAPHVYSDRPPSCTHYATKQCMRNGNWFKLSYQGLEFEWTNYTSCGASRMNRRRLYFQIITFAVSVASLIPAIAIFMAYRQLHIYRISMHKNFFVSLLLNGIVHIVFESVVMLDVLEGFDGNNIINRNQPWCKILFVLTKYFRMSNYMWMLCEGLYLHRLIVAAFAEPNNIILYYLLGWVFPSFPVTVYAIIRKKFNDERCWIFPFENFEWITDATYFAILFINLCLLCHIIWVLVTKLRKSKSNEPKHYRKTAAKTGFFLVPLFGLHLIVVIYRPKVDSCSLLEAYYYVHHALDGLQGFLVSLLYCYFNNEIHQVIKRSYRKFLLRRRIAQNGVNRTTRTANSSRTHAESLTTNTNDERTVT